MGTKNNFLFIVIMMLAAVSLPLRSHPAWAEEGKIIMIQTEKSAGPVILRVNPPELAVDKNIIVIWLNATHDHDVNIRFDDGKSLEEGTRDAMGFGMGKDGGYEAKYLPKIGTASLRFVKAGVYVYTIVSQPGDLPAKGKIIVR
jgi:hypothetical protein